MRVFTRYGLHVFWIVLAEKRNVPLATASLRCDVSGFDTSCCLVGVAVGVDV